MENLPTPELQAFLWVRRRIRCGRLTMPLSRNPDQDPMDKLEVRRELAARGVETPPPVPVLASPPRRTAELPMGFQQRRVTDSPVTMALYDRRPRYVLGDLVTLDPPRFTPEDFAAPRQYTPRVAPDRYRAPTNAPFVARHMTESRREDIHRVPLDALYDLVNLDGDEHEPAERFRTLYVFSRHERTALNILGSDWPWWRGEA
jgi:hypothetical protein